MSLTNIEGQDGCLFTIKGKKYIYAGLQKDKTGKKVYTFYGLDGLDGINKNDLRGFSLNSAINETKNNANQSVLQIVKSELFNEYIPGIPIKLRTLPGLPGPAAFYEIPGVNATPTRLTKITEKEKMLDPNNPGYVYRVGSNGPSIQYILRGKINNLKNFTNDYNKMILKKPSPRDIKQPVTIPLVSSSVPPNVSPSASSSVPSNASSSVPPSVTSNALSSVPPNVPPNALSNALSSVPPNALSNLKRSFSSNALLSGPPSVPPNALSNLKRSFSSNALTSTNKKGGKKTKTYKKPRSHK
jgi:hypothetical protein